MIGDERGMFCFRVMLIPDPPTLGEQVDGFMTLKNRISK